MLSKNLRLQKQRQMLNNDTEKLHYSHASSNTEERREFASGRHRIAAFMFHDWR